MPASYRKPKLVELKFCKQCGERLSVEVDDGHGFCRRGCREHIERFDADNGTRLGKAPKPFHIEAILDTLKRYP